MKKETSFKDYEFTSITGGILLVVGPLTQGSTVSSMAIVLFLDLQMDGQTDQRTVSFKS